MQTIGQLLRSLRLEKSLNLDDITNETNIAKHLLEFLENDNFSKLPSSAFTKGFIVSYARVVGLSPQKALAIFRRDFIIDESGKIMPKGLARPLDKETLVASKFLFIGGIVLLVVLFLGYLFYQLKGLNNPPDLEIIRPKANSIVKGPIISVKGFVSADATVYINGEIAEIFPTGEFRSSVQLPPGEQQIVIKAVSSQNKIRESIIPITVVDK